MSYVQKKEKLYNSTIALRIFLDGLYRRPKIAAPKSNREVIALEPVETMLARRTGRLAFARNRYLERIENDPELSKYDYLLVTDMDDASQGLTPESIAACFEYPITDWEVMTANQTHLYYDIWTLRHPIWCPGDCFVEINGRPDFITKDFLDHIAVGARMISIPTNRGLIPVDSAFGGAALYRLSFVKGCKYKGLYRKQTEVCEHVALNKQLREKGARIFINPRMINSDGVSWHAFHTAPPKRPHTPSKVRKRLDQLTHRIIHKIFGIDSK